MATRMTLDDALIDEAMRLGDHKTKLETVTTALQEYIRLKKRQMIHELIGKVDFYDDVDHKARRGRRKSGR